MTIRTIAGFSLAFFALGALAQVPAKLGFRTETGKAVPVQSSPILLDRTIGARALSDVNEAFKITAGSPLGQPDDRLGRAVAYSSDSIVIGAPSDDNGAFVDAGSVYVYIRSGAVWTRQQKIDPPVPETNAGFGSSVSISGNTLVIGSPLSTTSDGNASGAAYVYLRTGSTWALQQALDPAARNAGDRFGTSVDVEGDNLIVGSRLGDATNTSQGTAHVFTRSGSVWTEQQRLTASDGVSGDNFGNTVAFSGNSVIVGANLAFVSALESAGAAYVFVRNAGVWSQQQKLVAPTAGDLDEYGADVDIEGDTAIVGQRNEDGVAQNTGAARVYARSGNTWSLQGTLTATDAAANDFLGLTVALSGNFALVGAFTEDRTGLLNAGAAYLFERNGSNVWAQKDKYIASDAGNDDQFGFEVAMGPGFGVVGSPLDDNSDGVDAGATYVFNNGTPTTTTLGATENAFAYGESLILTAIVAPVATGTVSFLNNGSPVGSDVLSGLSQASLHLIPSPGSYNFTAHYLGDGTNLASSSNTQVVTVSKAETSLQVNLSAASVPYGQNVTITTTLTETAVGGSAPTGSIVFTDNSNFLASVPLSGGQAVLTRNNLPVGVVHNIVASYAGDTNFLGTTAGSVQVETTLADVAINVTSSPNPAARNTSQTFSATLTGGIPIGNVAFQALPLPSGSPIALGSPPINAGVAMVSSSALPVGSYTIRVIYVGDTNHNFAIADSAQPHVVTPAADLSIVKTNNQIYVTEGEQVTYTITVSNPANGDPVVGALVNDNVNAAYFDDSAAETTWTCTPTGNADCAASAGTGDISGLAVDLDPGTSVTILLTTRCRAEGNEFVVSNTATVVAPSGLTDSNLSNNTSVDADQSGLFRDGFE
ncbi:hypothetical protein C7S18_03865 [Ahniella affigens]|uniref:DUF11 domain-containing protein n=1 Tax=Ahniella affigens TaxID=2021234 RepID=A0A2P1PNG8_9GAMM|nr:Ig-like domain repeat protein [Ahniella affigens]AVP96379.1 hypothetical protein C7S18_03865 [Ahniella affigens]